MSSQKRKLSRHQRQQRRIWVMLLLSTLIPLLDILFGLTLGTIGGPVFDTEIHLKGRIAGATHFTLIYACIIARIVSGQQKRKSFLPIMLLLMLIGGIAFLFFIQYREQAIIQIMGYEFEGFHLRQFASGTASIMPSVALVMILTPVMIPAEYLANLGDMFSKDIQTGTQHFDDYLKFSRKRKSSNCSASNMPLSDHTDAEMDTSPDVLLVEDDLACAALVLKFCRKLKLECHHVESLDQAQEFFKKQQDTLRLLILDNFVRVGATSSDHAPKTGSEWAKQLQQQFPKDDRSFHVAILSGHTHLLAELGEYADIVLQKPWDPKQLFRFLKDHNIV
jgi:CheY-like chemotaxis protein